MKPMDMDSHEGDVLVINAWAKFFHFSDWFEWAPIGKMPRQHLQ
jgi:hypothetical protein